MEGNIVKIFSASAIFVPLFYFFYLSFNQQIFGIDAWYHLKFVLANNVFLANFLTVLMFFSPFLFFSFAENKKQNLFLVSSLFLLSPFCLRLLEFEADDYVFYLLSFSLITFFKNKKLNHRLLAISIVLFYVFLHSFFFHADNVHLEARRNPFVFFLVLPSLILLLANKKFKDFFLIVFLTAVFMNGKFVSASLVYFFSVYLDFLTSGFSFKKSFVAPFLLYSLVVYLVPLISLVEANKAAFEKYCDKETKICDNYEEPHYGHYFSSLGYVSNNTLEFGVCVCVGYECLIPKIRC